MQTIISAFEDRAAAERAVERLVDAGFDRDDIHVQEGMDSSTVAGTTTDTTLRTADAQDDEGVMGSIRHFFASLFGDDSPAGASTRYSEAVHRGHPVVVMDALDDSQAQRASAILHELGAFDVDERAAQWGRGSEPMSQPMTGRMSESLDDEKVLDVVQEELDVGKRTVDRGGVRVVQRMSEQPVSELVKLHQERAMVARRAVDRPATAEDLSNFREGTIEVRESAEVPVVSKKARVVEEVRVGKEVQDRTETITDTLRRKDVDVERLEGERERAVASDRNLDDKTLREGDLESRDTRDITKKRDI